MARRQDTAVPPSPAASKLTKVGPYNLGKTLGSGCTGEVKLAYHRETGHQVAIKIIRYLLILFMYLLILFFLYLSILFFCAHFCTF
jgi:serine/threonine protein kinase